MSSVPIGLERAPGARLISNNLVDTPSLIDLDQDLVLVELPGKIFIDVSWYPENERPGAYYVTVFRQNDWEHPIDSGEAETPHRAAWIVEVMAERHTNPIDLKSCSQDIIINYPCNEIVCNTFSGFSHPA